MELNNQVVDLLKAQLSTGEANNALLNNCLRLLGKWRSVLLQNTIVRKNGTVVLQGLLSGLDFLSQSSEGCHVAKLLGTYEQPLQLPLEKLISESNYVNIINIGCAEGYYAVGLALKFEGLISYAFDTDPNARQSCSLLAQKNSIESGVIVGEHFTHAEFERFSDTNSLVFVDIEGAEKQLLDPIAAPALRGLDIVVESHECLVPGITETLIDRFSETHEIIKIEDSGMRELSGMPSWFYELAHLDQLLSVWEWRSGPTPWLIMRSKQGSV